MTWTGLITILAMLVSMFPQVVGQPVPTASAHNLNADAVYVYFDANTQAYLDGLIATNQRPAGTPLLQPGDELGIIIKAVPIDGTTTGVGGYTTFYIPNGVQVVDAAYIMPGDLNADGITGFDKVPMKGQAQMPIVGAGGGPTVSLVGITRGPNILGVTSPVVTAGNTNLGTVVGVYGDTGIFYSTAPETAFGTYTGGKITNNSGDEVGLRTVLGTTLNEWDAWQMAGYGISGTTNPAYPSAALIDSNERGYAPWGFANVVAGPQSGYAWEFDFAKYTTCDPTPTATPTAACIDQATQDIGPWQRIKYPGSQFSDDPPGGTPSLPQPYTRGADASNSGFDLTAGDLPQTTGQANGTPVAVRWAYGQQTQNRPEYMWVKIKVFDNNAILDATGCPKWTVDTFGGDAGGDSGGKDHIWRYYDPNSVTFNGCLAVGKPATRELVKVGDTYQYKVKLYNAGSKDYSTVQIQDTLPSGVTYISAVPAPSSVSLPNLTWTVAPFLRSQMFEATVTVKASGSGLLTNNVCAAGTPALGGPVENSCGKDITVSGPQPLLRQSKSVTPSSVAPGGSVQYTVNILNVGSGPTGSPVVITEYLPAGFTYSGGLSTTVNGASVTASVSGPTSQPVFSVPSVINAGQSLVLTFNALVSATTSPGNYCNSYRVSEGGINQVTGALACVQVGGGAIGDLIYRDWSGDGARDATTEEGLPGVTVDLYNNSGCTGSPSKTTTTDTNGAYLFTGLTAGNFCVKVAGGVPAGYTLTGDPDGGSDGKMAVNLATDNSQVLNADFGYKPGGAGSIGDKVFDDQNGDGGFNGTDVGIDGVFVTLYEDTNGNGVQDAADALLGTATTSGGGNYGFSNLDPTRSYVVVATDGAGSAVDGYFATPYLSSTSNPQKVAPADFIAQGNAVTDADFGYFGQTPRAIGDQVFIDTNGNGTYQAGIDTPLPSITVYLFRDANGDGVAQPGELAATTASAADGSYLFSNLGPDNYIVVVDTADPQIPAGYFATVDHYDTPLTSAADVLTDDFPFMPLISKSVSATSLTPPGSLTFNITVNYPGDQLLGNVRVVDPLPKGVTFTSATAGGTDGAYVPLAKEDGIDDGPPATVTSLTASPTTVAQGGTVTVSMLLTNNDAASITGVTAGDLTVNGGSATCGAASPATPQTVASGAPKTFTYTCTVNSLGELTFTGGAEGTWSSAPYSFADGTSNSVLVSLEGMPNAVIWNLGSSTAGEDGVSYITGTGPGIYAFRGDDKTDFWRYEVLGNTWAAKAPALGTVKEGGALAYDGGGYAAGYIYGFRGDNTTKFWRYDIDANSWQDLTPADAPQNLGAGGALVYLNGYVYAFRGAGKPDFWRYDIANNNWECANGTLSPSAANCGTTYLANNVGQGGALTTDGTYIYALEGNGTKRFWRYDPVANTWLARKDTLQNVKWGGALTGIGNSIYAFRGDDKTDFWRYDIAANTWSILAPALGTVKEGGALTTDGTHVYGLRGDGATGFWRYDPSNNKWTALKVTLQNVKSGGALVYVPGTDAADFFTSISAAPTLASGGKQIKVTMTVYAKLAVNNLTPGTLTVTPVNGAGVSPANCGSPTPASIASLAANTPGGFTWTCTVSAGTNPGSLTFGGSATGTGPAVTFPAATSNSILVTPVLSYTGQVSASPGVNVVRNNAIISTGGGAFDPTPSNTTETAVTGYIGDLVWVDLDGDGTRDTGEPGLAGVEVCVVSTALCDVTDANGYYRIYGLTTGASYTVTPKPATLPSGYQYTTASSFLRIASDDTADFGLRPPGGGSIGDTVWVDSTVNGAVDPGEMLLPGITVNLYKKVGASYTLVATTTTDANGQYLFSGLYAGDYRVEVVESSSVTSPYDGTTTLAAALDVVSVAGSTTGTPPLTNTYDVTLASDTSTVSNADFGYNWTGSIGDTVWYDTDQDQVVDGGEARIPGATVLLYFDADNNGQVEGAEWSPIAIVLATDANGNYLFDHLPPGNYLVDVYEDSITTDGLRDIVPTTPDVLDVDLTAGQDVNTADFGYYIGAKVEGNVFWDEDRNGVLDPSEQDAPHLLENVTVNITCLGANGLPGGGDDFTDSKSTDGNGHFSFIVPPGPCTVSYVTTDPDIPAALGDQTTPASYSFTAQAGEDWHPSFDFGRDNTGKIGDTVWNDLSNPGVQDPGEPGLAGVTALLYRDNDNSNSLTAGDVFLASQATDATGKYLFPGLADGSYIVVVNAATLPTNYNATYDNSGSPDGVGQADLSGGTPNLTVDFGYKYSPPGGINVYEIRGTVWADTDGDGVLDAGEQAIPNVKVTLACGAYGTYVLTTTSSLIGGNYALANVPDGTTCNITVDPGTLPSAAYGQTGDPNVSSPPACSGAACDNTSTVTVTAANPPLQNFGYQERFGSISGTVCDGNGNGDCVGGEPPLADAKVTLTYAGLDGILNTGDDVVSSQTTLAGGTYSFTSLLPGLYQIVETNPAGYESRADIDGGNPDNISVVLGLGQNLPDQDFEDGTPGITIEKTPDPQYVTAGAPATFTIKVTNTGTVTLSGVAVTDAAVPGCAQTIGTLLPGAANAVTYTCTKTNVTTDFTNTATASGTSPAGTTVSHTDTALVDVVAPGIVVSKSANPTLIAKNGWVQYTYTVQNPGDTPLKPVTIADDKCSPLTGPSGDTNANGRLDPGETWGYLCNKQLTADTINTVDVEGTPVDANGNPLPGISTVKSSDSATVDVVAPAIELAKTVSTAGAPAEQVTKYPSDMVTYHFAVNNTGDTPLGSVNVIDPQCTTSAVQPVLSGSFNAGDTNTNGRLDTGETWQYTCTATPAVDVTNTGTAFGQPTNAQGQPLPGIGGVSDTDTASVNVINPQIAIDKIAAPTQVALNGSVTYTFNVTNPGDDPLSNVAVDDPLCTPVAVDTTPADGFNDGDTNKDNKLDPGETWKYTCTKTGLTYDITNRADATGKDSLGGTVTASDTAFVDVIIAGIDIVKTANPTTVYNGGSVTYSFDVSNTGTNWLANVTVSDSNCTPVPTLSGGKNIGDTNQDNRLDPGEVWKYTCTRTLTQDTTNTATATGTDELGAQKSDTATAEVNVINPAINVAKRADKTYVAAGGLVFYTYDVTNPGDDPLSNVTVSDNKCNGGAPLTLTGGDTNPANGKLDPGETWTYICSTNLAATTTNVVTATGKDSLGNTVGPDTDSVTVTVAHPQIQVVKSVDKPIVLAGTAVQYTYVVTNPGDVPLRIPAGNGIVDNKCAAITGPTGSGIGDGLLNPGDVWTYTCTTTITADTTNTVTVTGVPSDPNSGLPLPGFTPVTGTAQAVVDVVTTGIAIVKTATPAIVYPGQTVVYTFAVTNLGQLPLAGVTVNDNNCSPVTGPAAGGDANSNGLLDLTETWTFTCSKVITEDTPNVATAQGQPAGPQGQPLPWIPPVQAQAGASVDAINPAILLSKSASPTVVAVGGSVTYTFVVTNPGDDPLSNVTVTDPLCTPVAVDTTPVDGFNDGDTDKDNKLDPGESWRYTCTKTVTQDTTNVAQAQGTDSKGGTVSDTDEAFVDVAIPGIAIEKTATPTVMYSGGTVLYNYTVRNTGGTPLNSVSVSDDKCNPVLPVDVSPADGYNDGDANKNNLLDITEVWRYTCTTTLTADTTNTATVTGKDSAGTTVEDDAIASVNVINPALTVTKVADKTVVLAGTQVVYTYAVKNTGDDPLHNPTLGDNKCTPVLYTGGDANNNGVLDPGETWTYVCTATITADTDNTATAKATDSLGGEQTAQAVAHVEVVRPAITVVKSANPAVVLAGTMVQYQYLVTNTGDVPLSAVNVGDNKCSSISGPTGDNGNGLLDPGETWTYTCAIAISVDTTNIVTVSGKPSTSQGVPLTGLDPVSDTDEASVDVVRPAIHIEKTAAPTLIHPGETVVYTYVVTNPGDVPLRYVTVGDNPTCSPILLNPAGDTNSNGLLDTTETWVYTCTAVLTQTTTNTATAVGLPTNNAGSPLPGIQPVSDQDDATVTVIRPAIQITKTPSAVQVQPGTIVKYTYEVYNPTTNVAITNVSVLDDVCAPVTKLTSDTILDPGQTWLFECSMPLNQDTTNVATVTGTDPLGGQVSDTDTAFVDVLITGLQVDKSASATVIYQDGSVTYTYLVSNTGTDPLSNVQVEDDKCEPENPVLAGNGKNVGDTNANDKLDPGEVWRYTCTTTLAATTVNTVTATALDSLGQPEEARDTAEVKVITPAINVVKTADKTVILANGQVVYTYVVTNPGNDPLSQVTLADNKCSPLLLNPAGDLNRDGKLDPGETWVYTCTKALSATTTNTATVTGVDSLGGTVSDTDDETVTVVRPAIDVTKLANKTVVLAGGTVIYTYQVKNTGDTALNPVIVTDDKCSSPAYQSGDFGSPSGNGLLDPNETWIYTCSTALTVDTTNTATAVGQPADASGTALPLGTVLDTDTKTVDVVAPRILVEKIANPTAMHAGDSVTYTYRVYNPGDTPLSNVTVVDDKCNAGVPLTRTGGDTNNNNRLDPGEIWTYTCTTTLAQTTTNTVVASGQPTNAQGGSLPDIGPVEDQTTATVQVLAPAIQVVKTASATQVLPGTPVIYTYEVTNPGNTPLRRVAVTDDKCTLPVYVSGDGANPGWLDPGETWIYTCTATLNQDTTNTATATGEDRLGKPATDTDTEFVDVLYTGLQISKSADSPYTRPGAEVTYTYVVQNTGSDPISNVIVTDNKCNNGQPLTLKSGDTNNNGKLDPGEVWRYECKTVLTADPTTNVATVTGKDGLGNPVPPDQDSVTVDVIHPAIDVVKSANKTVVLPNGQVVYTYVVTNPGDDPLSNVTVEDNKCEPEVYQGGDTNNNSKLDPGETWTYTCTTALSVTTTNIVDATGIDSLGGPVTHTAQATVRVADPKIALDKDANRSVVLASELVLYTYLVTNPSTDVPLANVSVTDDKCNAPGPTYMGGDLGTPPNGLLDPGETWRYTCSMPVWVDTTNTGAAEGQPADTQGQPLPGIGPVRAIDTWTVDVVAPAILILKSVDKPVIRSGESVTYSYAVTNPGDVPLANVIVTDNKCNSGQPLVRTGGDTNGNNLLESGETWTYSCTTALTVDTENTGTVTGQPATGQGQALPGIGPVSDTDTAFVDVINPAITIDKAADKTVAAIGQNIIYTYVVKNTGDSILDPVTVVDDKCSPVTRLTGDGNGKLDPGETWTYQCVHLASPNDPDPLVNKATATGKPPIGPIVTAEDTWTTDLIWLAQIGDKVWWDVNGNGQQDSGEPGIPGVTVNLLDSAAAVIGIDMTDANGLYSFPFLQAGSYTVQIAPAEFTAGGTLESWGPSPQNVGSDATDSDGDPVNHDAGVTLAAGQTNDTIDFGFTIASSYTVKKELMTTNPARPGQMVQFKITIENTGKTWLSTVPLVDVYNNTFLTYGFGGDFATPNSDDIVNDGVINWGDLTQALPKGFGVDLEPGQTFEVVVTFTARQDTGVAGTQNTVTVSGVAADPDGPNGPVQPAVPPQTPQTGNSTVKILNPTGDEIAGFGAAAGAEGIVITWQTASEARILGFNILRQAADGEPVQANAELIFAEQSGASAGASYAHTDSGVPAGAYTYILQIVRLDGTSVNYETTATVTTASGG